jgi:hypothetical protein
LWKSDTVLASEDFGLGEIQMRK